MLCVRCPGVTLDEGGVLSSASCARCGGALIPPDGTHRLLEEELGHAQAELRELASLVAGARLPCPACAGRMSPLRLRGASLDLCFGCGALWTDAGELERVSGGRYRGPSSREAPVLLTGPPRALVRVDERSGAEAVLRRGLWIVGGLGLVSAFSLTAIPFAPGIGVTLTALVAAAALTRRRVTDVLPRARKLVRWRGLVPPVEGTERPEELPDAMVVVVRGAEGFMRRFFTRFHRIELVDGEGRVLVPLRRAAPAGDAEEIASEFAAALGVPLRIDTSLPPEPLEARAAVLGAATRVAIDDVDEPAPGQRRLVVRAGDNRETVLALAHNTRPLGTRARTLRGVLDGHWVLSSETGVLARLLPSARFGQSVSLLVHADGTLLGHVRCARGPLHDVVEWAAPKRTRVARFRLAHGASWALLHDTSGAPRGRAHIVRRPGRPASVVLELSPDTFPGATGAALIAMLLHLAFAPEILEH